MAEAHDGSGAPPATPTPCGRRRRFVLLRYPGLFVSIAVGALLLALAASAYPLFISASASELVKARIDDPTYTRWAVGMMYRNGAMPLRGSPRHGDVETPRRRADPQLRRGGPLPRPPGRVGPRQGGAGLGPRRAGSARDASVHRRAGALERRHPRGLRGRRRPGPRSGFRRARDLARRHDRGRIARRGDGHAPRRRDLPVPVPGRGLRATGDRGTTSSSCIARLRPTRPGADPSAGTVRRRGSGDRARSRQLRVAGAAHARSHPAGGGGRRADHLAHLRPDRRRGPCSTDASSRSSATGRAVRSGGARSTTSCGTSTAGWSRSRDPRGCCASPASWSRSRSSRAPGAFAMAARRVESTLLFARGARPRAVGGRAASRPSCRAWPVPRRASGSPSRFVRDLGPDGALATDASAQAMWSGAIAAVGGHRGDRRRLDRLVPSAIRTPPQPVRDPRADPVGARAHRVLPADPAAAAERRGGRGRPGSANEGAQPAALRVPHRVPRRLRRARGTRARPAPHVGPRPERRLGDALLPRGRIGSPPVRASRCS